MAPFARDGMWSSEDVSIHDDASARARANDDAEDDGTVCTGAISGLRQRKAVCVIGDANLAAERLAQILVEWMSDKFDGVGVLDEPSSGRNRPWDANAHRGLLAACLFDFGNQRGYRVDHGCVVSLGSRDAQPLSLDARFIDGDSFDLGAT